MAFERTSLQLSDLTSEWMWRRASFRPPRRVGWAEADWHEMRTAIIKQHTEGEEPW